jgi:hypothetical protein
MGLFNFSLSSRFLTKIVYALLSSGMHAAFSAKLILHGFIILITVGEEYKL